MNKEAFEAYVEIWNGADFDRLESCISENLIRNVPETVNQSTDSLSGLIEVMKSFRKAFPDGKVTLDEVHYMDNYSFAKYTYTGTNTGDGDFPATGKSVSTSGSSFVRFEDGKIVQEDVYYDALGFMIQLGIIELPSEESAATA